MGGKKSKPTTVGYKYSWDIHSGLGRGPVDEIVELRVDDKTAYVCKPNEVTRSQAIFIDKPNLFGGDGVGGEGGIRGRMEFLMGEPDQKPSQMLVNLLKGVYNPQIPSDRARKIVNSLQNITASISSANALLRQQVAFSDNKEVAEAEVYPTEMIPGFRGIVTTVFSGLISCYNAYPKKHSYRLRRALKGWHNNAAWYPEKCRIVLRNDTIKISGLTTEQEENVRQIHAMNPAHILLECATNKSWGGGKNLSDLDLDSYKKAADKLYEEGFGICIRYNRQGSIKDFMQEIIDHIGAVQYEDIRTGKQAIRLLRDDYNPDDLHTFSYENGILRVQDDDSAATDTAANQIIVKWRDPIENKEQTATANNIAAIQMHGVITKTVEYKGIPTFDLAARLAQRDLEMTASSFTRLKIVFDRRGSDLKLGDVFKVHLPDRNIDSAIFRVGELENGDDEELIVTCMQDVFGLSATNYSSQQSESLYVPPDYGAKPIENAQLFEVPYHAYPYIFSEADMSVMKPTDCLVWSLASSPSSLSVGYNVMTDMGAGFVQTAEMSFTSYLKLSADITPYQTTVNFFYDGEYLSLYEGLALMIGDEIVKVKSVDLENATLTIGRGCADTIPQAHQQGALMWDYLSSIGSSSTKYTANENLKVKLLTRTQQEVLSEEEASVLTITTKQRQARPYPPANVKVNEAFTNNISNAGNFKLTWSHRDRDIQSDQLISHEEESTVLGEGVSYRVDLMKNGNVVRSIKTTGTEFSYPDSEAVSGENFTKIELYSVKNGLTSLHRYAFNVS